MTYINSFGLLNSYDSLVCNQLRPSNLLLYKTSANGKILYNLKLHRGPLKEKTNQMNETEVTYKENNKCLIHNIKVFSYN